MHEELLTVIEREVLSWPGVSKETRGTDVTPGIAVTIYWLGRRQIGHIHHDGVADVQFPKALHDELIAAGRAEPHRGGFAAVVSFPIRQPDDVPNALALFRLSYDRIMAKSTANDDSRAAAGAGLYGPEEGH
ncbi:MAG TPA: luciferase family protein [Dehalococcoidia bacterium]|nr:luciferase family protein [Dehalococcoidia bacterium]